MVEKKARGRKKAEVSSSPELMQQAEADRLMEKITKVKGLIDLIDDKIKEKIEEDMIRVRITTNTAERELEGYSLGELKEMRKLYVSELKGYEKELSSISGKAQSRMIRPFFAK